MNKYYVEYIDPTINENSVTSDIWTEETLKHEQQLDEVQILYIADFAKWQQER